MSRAERRRNSRGHTITGWAEHHVASDRALLAFRMAGSGGHEQTTDRNRMG